MSVNQNGGYFTRIQQVIQQMLVADRVNSVSTAEKQKTTGVWSENTQGTLKSTGESSSKPSFFRFGKAGFFPRFHLLPIGQSPVNGESLLICTTE